MRLTIWLLFLSELSLAAQLKWGHCMRDKCKKRLLYYQGKDITPEYNWQNCYGNYITTVSACFTSSIERPDLPTGPSLEHLVPVVSTTTVTAAGALCTHVPKFHMGHHFTKHHHCRDEEDFRSACTCLKAKHTTLSILEPTVGVTVTLTDIDGVRQTARPENDDD